MKETYLYLSIYTIKPSQQANNDFCHTYLNVKSGPDFFDSYIFLNLYSLMFLNISTPKVLN
jgi:hypothetical protein